MPTVTISQASSSLSGLVFALERGQEREIVITRNGRPVARVVPIDVAQGLQRIGIAKGKFEVPEPSSTHDEAVLQLFIGSAEA